MAGAALVQSTTAGSSTAVASLTPTFGAASTAGGFLVAILTQFQTGLITLPGVPADPTATGWSNFRHRTQTGGTLLALSRLTTWIAWRVNAPATSSVTFTFDSTSNVAESVVLAEFSGIYTSGGTDSTGGAGSSNAVSTLAMSLGTAPSQDGELVIMGFGCSNTVPETFTPGTGFTKVTDTGTTLNCATTMDYQVQNAATASTDTQTFAPAREVAGQAASFKATQAAVRTITETNPTITDALARSLGLTRGLTETSTVTDSVARVGGFKRAFSDTGPAITDSISNSNAETRSMSETNPVITDAITLVSGKVRTMIETLPVISVVVTRAASFFRTMASTLAAITDSVGGDIITAFRSITDANPVISDSITATSHPGRLITETLPVISDALLRSLSLHRGSMEALATVDSIAAAQSLARALNEVTSVSDFIVAGVPPAQIVIISRKSRVMIPVDLVQATPARGRRVMIPIERQ